MRRWREHLARDRRSNKAQGARKILNILSRKIKHQKPKYLSAFKLHVIFWLPLLVH